MPTPAAAGSGGLGRTIKALVTAWFVPQRIRPFLGSVNQRDLDTITGLIEAGKITPVIDRTYPLAHIPEAVGYLGRGTPAGKIIITT